MFARVQSITERVRLTKRQCISGYGVVMLMFLLLQLLVVLLAVLLPLHPSEALFVDAGFLMAFGMLAHIVMKLGCRHKRAETLVHGARKSQSAAATSVTIAVGLVCHHCRRHLHRRRLHRD